MKQTIIFLFALLNLNAYAQSTVDGKITINLKPGDLISVEKLCSSDLANKVSCSSERISFSCKRDVLYAYKGNVGTNISGSRYLFANTPSDCTNAADALNEYFRNF